jgi:transcriptional regulator NrdR family protein
VRRIETSGDGEVPSTRIGELAMESLAGLDEVAYVRFASVYKDSPPRATSRSSSAGCPRTRPGDRR